MPDRTTDIAILGGGLAGGLIARALARRRPGVGVTIFEAGESLGGNHVWSFFATDIDAGDLWLVEPLVAAAWPSYEVLFHGTQRFLKTPYRTILSERLDAVLREELPAGALRTGVEVVSATATSVTLADGTTIAAGGVIDARGFVPSRHLTGGWQKFVGQVHDCPGGHGVGHPTVMNARVSQWDGFRFVYTLPLSPTELFLEDTYYSDAPLLDMAKVRDSLAAHARMIGCPGAVTREEQGVLPVIAGGDFDAFWNESGGDVAKAGGRAALFHPLTSYSLPSAVRFAVAVAGESDLSGAALAGFSRSWAQAHWRRSAFYRKLAAMLFAAADPDARTPVFRRFYGLDQRLIERFYAGRSTYLDKVRLLSGKPPVPVGPALAVWLGRRKPPPLA